MDDIDAQGGPIDSDEEKEAVMAAIARSNPQPMARRVPITLRNKYNYIRMKDMFRPSFAPARLGRENPTQNSSNNASTAPTPIDTNIAAHHRGGMLGSASLASAGLDSNFGGFASPALSSFGDVSEQRRASGVAQGGPRQILPGQLPGPGSRKQSIAAGGG